MYRQLQIDHSLYMINENVLNEFKIHIATFQEIQPHFNVMHTKIDTWAAIFNNWLLLISKKDKLIIDHTKTFSNSIDILCCNELERHEAYERIIQSFNRKDLCIVACFITNHIHDWQRGLMQINNCENMIETNLRMTDYYSASNLEFTRTKKKSKQLLNQQSKFIKVLIKDIRSTEKFHTCIRCAIEDAQLFLRENKVSVHLSEEIV